MVVTFTEEQIQQWKEDPAAFFQFRREIEHEQHLSYNALMQGSEDQVNVYLPIIFVNIRDKLSSQIS